jgi:hypothetical protein
MACNPEVLKQVLLFASLDEEEPAVLAGQIGLTTFAARQRIYKRGEAATRAYVVLSGGPSGSAPWMKTNRKSSCINLGRESSSALRR